MFKVYIVKYALSDGIIETTGRHSSSGNSTYDQKYVWVPHYKATFRLGTAAFLSLSDALKKAEELRKRKIVSLQMQLTELENKTIVVRVK